MQVVGTFARHFQTHTGHGETATTPTRIVYEAHGMPDVANCSKICRILRDSAQNLKWLVLIGVIDMTHSFYKSHEREASACDADICNKIFLLKCLFIVVLDSGILRRSVQYLFGCHSTVYSIFRLLFIL